MAQVTALVDAESTACPSTSRTRKMPPFPAFEAPSSFERYAEGEAGGVYACPQSRASSASDRAVAESAGELSLEARTDAVVTCVCSQAPLREVLYKTLVHCIEPRDFSEVEDFIAAQDEFVYSHIIQTPFTLVQMLLCAYGLEQTPLDEAGQPLAPERFEGLSEDEADDLVATYELSTTDAGKQAVDLLSPARRIRSQIMQKPHRAHTFYQVLDFCTTPRKFPEIQDYFKQEDDLVLDTVQANQKLSPDFYVDRLEKAGGLVWRGAWVTTDAGKQALATRCDAPCSK